MTIDRHGALAVWFSAAVLVGLFLWFYIDPSQAYARGHDFLDHVFAFYVVWSRQAAGFGTFDAIVEQLANGLPLNSLALGDFGIGPNLYRLFDPFTAFVFNEVLRRTLGFIGGYLLLRDHLVGGDRRGLWIAALFGLMFAIVPDQSNRFGTIILTPLLAWALVNFLRGRMTKASWLVILFYPFYSVLFLGGWVVCGYVALATFLSQFARLPGRWHITGAFAVLCILFVFAEVRMFYQWFAVDYVSYRHLVTYSGPSFKGFLSQFRSEFVFGNNANNVTRHSPVFLTIVAATSVMLVFARFGPWRTRLSNASVHTKFVESLFWALLALAVVNAGINALDQSGFFDFKFALGFPFSFHRVDLTSPLIWHLLVALAFWLWFEITAVRWRPAVAIALVLVAGYTIVLFPGVKEEIKIAIGAPPEGGFKDALLGRSVTERPFRTVKQDYNAGYTKLSDYYLPTEYARIEADLRPVVGRQSMYRTISFGITPSVAQFNGFYTLDGLYYDVPARYAREFVEVFVNPELAKDNLEAPTVTGGLVMSISTKTLHDGGADLSFDTCRFVELGGRVMFSRWPLLNQDALGLKLFGEYPHVFIYLANPSDCLN